METYYKLLSDLEHNLKALESKINNLHCLSEQSIILCKHAFAELKIQAQGNNFKSEAEEIEFYKFIKPKVVSNLIFNIKRLYIESERPKEGKKEQVRYLKRNITKLQKYFNNNLEFYHYYKSKASHLDDKYFLQKNKTVRLNIEAYHFFTEEDFSTSHDSTVATIMAYTNLIKYLKSEIAKLNNKNNMETTISPFQQQSQLVWTGNNNELVELIYALYSSGRINNGNVEIKSLTSTLEHLFNADLGNYYQSFNDIRARKLKPTKFIDTLKESLTKYMNDLDNIR